MEIEFDGQWYPATVDKRVPSGVRVGALRATLWLQTPTRDPSAGERAEQCARGRRVMCQAKIQEYWGAGPKSSDAQPVFLGRACGKHVPERTGAPG